MLHYFNNAARLSNWSPIGERQKKNHWVITSNSFPSGTAIYESILPGVCKAGGKVNLSPPRWARQTE